MCVPNRVNIPGYKMVNKNKKNMKLYESLTQLNLFVIILNNSLRLLRDLGTNKKSLSLFLIHPRIPWFSNFDSGFHQFGCLGAGCSWEDTTFRGVKRGCTLRQWRLLTILRPKICFLWNRVLKPGLSQIGWYIHNVFSFNLKYIIYNTHMSLHLFYDANIMKTQIFHFIS